MIRRRVVVRGRVQGVFFRDTCRREARSRGVSGWVRNVDDGSVEAVVEGEDEAVEAMLAWCRQGPAAAQVTAVDVSEEEPGGDNDFRIR